VAKGGERGGKSDEKTFLITTSGEDRQNQIENTFLSIVKEGGNGDCRVL